MLLVIAVMLLLAYVGAAVLYARSASNRGLSVEATPPPGGVAVTLEVISIDPALSTLRARMTMEPSDELVDSAGQLRQAISVITNLTRDQTNYPAGQRPAVEDVTLFMQGSYEDYPLDRWVTAFIAIAFPTASKNGAGEAVLETHVGFHSSVAGWVSRQISFDDLRTEIPDASVEGPVSLIAVGFSRAGSTLAIVVLVLVLMVVLAALGIAVSIAVARGRRRLEPTMAGFLAALLFALIPLRNALPGAPPLGAWIDMLVFFWVEIMLMAALALFVTTWLMRGPRPDGSAVAVVVPLAAEEPRADGGSVGPDSGTP